MDTNILQARRFGAGVCRLVETWKVLDSTMDSYAIIATKANQMAGLHDRMPLILNPEHYNRWITGKTGGRSTARALLVRSA